MIKMKLFCTLPRLVLVLLLFPLVALSAEASPVSDTLRSSSLLERLGVIEQRTDKFHFILHLNASFDANFSGDSMTQAAFRVNQARLEARGQLTPRLSYQWRQRLNKSNAPEALDNLPASIDCAWIRLAFPREWTLTLGKQGAAYGGFEYDLDPIEIYQYSDMCDYMIFDFMTGVTLSWQPLPSHQFQLQALNARCGSTASVYGRLPDDTRESRLPLAYTLNWNGNFFGDRLRTRWSFTLLNQAHRRHQYYYALGNQFRLFRFEVYLDYSLSDEDLDCRGILTSLLQPADGTPARHARYESWVTRLSYRFDSRWNAFLQGMHETASLRESTDACSRGKYRTALGYFAGVEYYPTGDNLRFYLVYLGRSYRFTDRAAALGQADHSTTRLSLGFIYHLPLF